MSISDAARELSLYVENDGALHRQQEVPIRANLMTKRARGQYSHAGAVKAYEYLMESGAKKYAKDHGSPGTPWHVMFTVADRRQAAEEFAKAFEVEAKLGNYDSLLPKKYQGGGTGTKKTPGQLDREVKAALVEDQRVEIVRAGDSSYFKPGQYGYVVGTTDRGGMHTLDGGPSLPGGITYLVSKRKKKEGGAAFWFSKGALRFARAR